MLAAIGLGSSLGDRRAHLRRGLAGLRAGGLELAAVSALWETEPVGSTSGLWFLNMVATARTVLSPRELLRLMQGIEMRVGRVRGAANAPRTLDLDLLDLGGAELREADLELPHPRMWRRRFVLAPLAEVAPALTNPRTGRTAGEELAVLRDEAIVVRVGWLEDTEAEPAEPAAIIRRGSLQA